MPLRRRAAPDRAQGLHWLRVFWKAGRSYAGCVFRRKPWVLPATCAVAASLLYTFTKGTRRVIALLFNGAA